MQETPELWVLCGNRPVMFRIPYYVAWRGNDARIEPAIALRPMELEAAAKVLSLTGRHQNGQWTISRAMLERVGEKTDGGDPESHFSWSRSRPKEQRVVEGRNERNEFLESLYLAGVGESVDQLAYYWREFCQHAAHWLINKEKPVDMIFLRLHNCPYRENWKVILTQRFPRLGLAISRRSGDERDRVLRNSGFLEGLLSLDLLAFQRNTETCYRRVEVEHCKGWWGLIRNAEKQRMASGANDYADYFLDSLKRFIPTARKLYTAWLAQIAKPCVRDFEGGYRSRVRFVPDHLAGSMHPTAGEYCGLPIRVGNKLPFVRKPRGENYLSAPNGPVPPLPNLQPPAKNVRQSAHARARPDVDEPRNGAG